MYKDKIDERPSMYNGQKERPEEIDLREIFSFFKRGIDNVGNSIKRLISLIFNNKAVLAAFTLIGMLLAFGAFYVTKPYYNSSMTLVLAEIRNDFVEDQLMNITEMVEENNFDALSERLDISYEAAQQIKSMEFSNLDEVAEDSILTGSPFRIELSLYDNSLFNSLEPALVTYLENNRYFSKQKRVKQKQMENMISKLKGEISSIDSLKTQVAEPRGPVSGFVYGEPIDPTNLYRESITMFQQQVELEAELDQLDNIQIVNGFTPRTKPTGPKLLLYLAVGAALSFFVGLVVVAKKDTR